MIIKIRRCADCRFVGKEAYHGAHIWCEHPEANGISLPNRDTEIHPDCPITTVKIVRHAEGEYLKNVCKYGNIGEVERQFLEWKLCEYK